MCYSGDTKTKGEFQMYKYLKDMDNKELMELFNNNSTIRERAENEAIDNAYFWCREYCDVASAEGKIEYQYGMDCWCYLKHKEDYEYDFLCAVSRLQKDFYFLADEWTTKIVKAKRLLCDMGEEEDESKFAEMENRFYSMLEEIEEACGKRLQEEFDYAISREVAEESFIERIAYDMGNFIADEDYNVYQPDEIENCVIFNGKIFEKI